MGFDSFFGGSGVFFWITDFVVWLLLGWGLMMGGTFFVVGGVDGIITVTGMCVSLTWKNDVCFLDNAKVKDTLGRNVHSLNCDFNDSRILDRNFFSV